MRALSICITLSVLLFTVGCIGVLLRKKLLMMVMSVQVMLLGVVLALVTFSRVHGLQNGLAMDGQVMALGAILWGGMQVVLGVGLLQSFYRSNRQSEEVDSLGEL